MRVLFAAVVLSCVPQATAQYSMWHALDPMPVVCDRLPMPNPLPTGMTAAEWPTKQEFPVLIKVDNGMRADYPHMVTFLRTKKTALSITFDIKDNSGVLIMPSTTVQLLDATSGFTNTASCACTGSNLGVDVAFYGSSYGTNCSAWDSASCTAWFPEVTPGEWCCTPWCYVPKECPDAYVSEVYPGLYWSYQGACGDVPHTSPCPYSPPDPCECINVDATSQFAASVTEFGAGYGSTCKTWAYDDCSDKYEVVGPWCCEQWCWVKEECSTSVASDIWPELFWSTNKCVSEPEKVATCPYRNSTGVTTSTVGDACACLGTSPPDLTAGRRRYGKEFPVAYGTMCSAWDAADCAGYFPNDKHDIWCCETWCYVDRACPSAQESWLFSGYYFSYDACPQNGTALAGCAYSDACKPTGANTGLDAAALTKYGADYGKSCKAWDATKCKEWYEGTDRWSASGSKDWCCDSWAYVNESCPIVNKSSVVDTLFFSSGICPKDGDAGDYKADTAECAAQTSRRLEGEESGSSEEHLSSPGEDEIHGRRLASRRRSSSSGSSPRRRAPSTPPRRRAPAPPRRRASPATPPRRRRGPPAPSRRRRTPPPGPPPPQDVRRRRTEAGDTSLRRRTQSVSGNSHSTDTTPRRRSDIKGDVRRRETSYGYTSQNQLQNNYGSTMPAQTSYGYSGTGPKQNSKVPMMMAGGLGLAGGAVLGVGSYYAYQRMSRNNWGGNYNDRSYCTRPGSSYQMRCSDCAQRYGNQCVQQNQCYTGGSGCQYRMPTQTQRDDVMKAGFVPSEHAPPFVVSITAMSGTGYSKADICLGEQPDNGGFDDAWEKASEFDVGVFVTLTEMESLDPPPTYETVSAGYTAGTNWLVGILIIVHFLVGRRVRM